MIPERRCTKCGGDRFWKTATSVVVCMNCDPPLKYIARKKSESALKKVMEQAHVDRYLEEDGYDGGSYEEFDRANRMGRS